MPRRCGVCQEPLRNELDRRLLEMEFSGETFRKISHETGYSESSLCRHKGNHLTEDLSDIREEMAKAREQALTELKMTEMEEIKVEAAKGMAARLENAASLLDQLREVRSKAASLLDQAEAAQDLRAAGTLLKELREQIRFMAELEGKMATQTQINLQQSNVSIYDSKEWLKVSDILQEVLASYPEAKTAAAIALIDLARRERT